MNSSVPDKKTPEMKTLTKRNSLNGRISRFVSLYDGDSQFLSAAKQIRIRFVLFVFVFFSRSSLRILKTKGVVDMFAILLKWNIITLPKFSDRRCRLPRIGLWRGIHSHRHLSIFRPRFRSKGTTVFCPHCFYRSNWKEIHNAVNVSRRASPLQTNPEPI